MKLSIDLRLYFLLSTIYYLFYLSIIYFYFCIVRAHLSRRVPLIFFFFLPCVFPFFPFPFPFYFPFRGMYMYILPNCTLHSALHCSCNPCTIETYLSCQLLTHSLSHSANIPSLLQGRPSHARRRKSQGALRCFNGGVSDNTERGTQCATQLNSTNTNAE